MEKLATHLEGQRKGDFAKLVNISGAYLSQLMSGVRQPSLDVALRIERATDGRVPVESWPAFAVLKDRLIPSSGAA